MFRKRDDYGSEVRNVNFVEDELVNIVNEIFFFSNYCAAHAIANHSVPEPEEVEKIVFSLEHLLNERKLISSDFVCMHETEWNLVPFVHHISVENFDVAQSLFEAQLFTSQLQKEKKS